MWATCKRSQEVTRSAFHRVMSSGDRILRRIPGLSRGGGWGWGGAGGMRGGGRGPVTPVRGAEPRTGPRVTVMLCGLYV